MFSNMLDNNRFQLSLTRASTTATCRTFVVAGQHCTVSQTRNWKECMLMHANRRHELRTTPLMQVRLMTPTLSCVSKESWTHHCAPSPGPGSKQSFRTLRSASNQKVGCGPTLRRPSSAPRTSNQGMGLAPTTPPSLCPSINRFSRMTFNALSATTSAVNFSKGSPPSSLMFTAREQDDDDEGSPRIAERSKRVGSPEATMAKPVSVNVP